MEFLSYLLTGISLGSVYAIIALGYSMVYGIAKMLNFAHGDVIMVGGYMVFIFMNSLGLPAIVAILGAMAECRQPGGADHRHRRQLSAAEPGADHLGLHPQELPLGGLL